MSYFSGRVILITGAASGIGRQLALHLSREGAAIGAVDRNAEVLPLLAQEINGKLSSVVADVTRPEQVQEAVRRIEEELGPVDMLIASAGIGMETSGMNFQSADMESLIGVNLLGVAHSIAAVLPGMLQRRAGHIVALSSLASFRGLPLMAGYCASKAGVNSMMEALRVELKDQNISFTTVCPGWVRTPMTANLGLPGIELLEVEEATRRIVEAIRRRRRFYAFPPRQARQVRLLRWLPLAISDWLTARILLKLKKRQIGSQ